MDDERLAFVDKLSARLGEINVICSARQTQQLASHFALLKRFAKVHNLTTVLELDKAVDYHYADCLKGLSFLEQPEVLMDVGSGAGFPGLIAAILWPSTDVTLVETVRKKCSFLRTAVVECGLNNVEVLNENVFELALASQLVTRATFPQEELIRLITALPTSGKLACFISERQVEAFEKELAQAQLGSAAVHRYEVGGVQFALGQITRY